MWRTMEILLKNVAYNGNPPPAGKIYNPNPPTRADPRRSSAAGRENLQSKSASVVAVAVVAVVVATRESRLCRHSAQTHTPYNASVLSRVFLFNYLLTQSPVLAR